MCKLRKPNVYFSSDRKNPSLQHYFVFQKSLSNSVPLDFKTQASIFIEIGIIRINESDHRMGEDERSLVFG